MFQPDQQELSINTPQIKKAALVFRAISHPLRLQILNLIHKAAEIKVTDIYTELHLNQSVTSQHLGILRQAGFVITRRDQRKIFYSVNYQRIRDLHTIAAKLIV